MKRDIDQLRIDLKKEGYAVIQHDDGKLHSYPYDSPWLTDKKFNKIYNSIRNNTLVDRVRCYHLYLLIQQIKKLPGDILEVGTWRGGTAGIFTQLLPDKMVYLADTFKGIVKSSTWEHYEDKAHSDTSEKLVRNFLKNDLGVSNFKILNGVFPEDTGKKVASKALSLVYLDADVYQSTKDAFEYVWKNITKGGIVVFDDYGMISACKGISKFVHEIKDDTDKLFIPNLNGQAYVVKQ
jgi:O-methyltransferase